MYNLWLGVHKFSRKLEALQKAWIQKSGINEIQNLKYKYSLGDVAHMIWKYLKYVCHLTQSCKWLSSVQTLEMQIFRWFIPVVRTYKYNDKWVCTSNTTIFIGFLD